MTEWQTIPTFPAYEASDGGQIRRTIPYYSTRGLLPLRQAKHKKTGYLYVSVSQTKGRFVTRMVHCLVCEAFHGLRPSRFHEAAHWDGDKSHNYPSNLRWATKIENAADTIRLGRQMAGSSHWATRLTANQVDEIRRRWPLLPRNPDGKIKRGAIAVFAEELGAHRKTVASVGRGDTWAGRTL